MSIPAFHSAVRANNSLLVDVRVTTGANVERVSITYRTTGDRAFPDLYLQRGQLRPSRRSGGNRKRGGEVVKVNVDDAPLPSREPDGCEGDFRVPNARPEPRVRHLACWD